jgi:hypothetical protein
MENCAEGGEVAPWRPDIVHFIGHGRAGQLMIRLAEEDDDGFVQGRPDPQFGWMSSEDFSKALGSPPPRLVFLHACQGAAPSELKGVCSTARDLLNAKIPAIVAMQCSISNDDAGEFAREFYDRLHAGVDVEEAVQDARRKLRDAPKARSRQRFGTPVLYLQTRDRILTLPQEPPRKPEFQPAESIASGLRQAAGRGLAPSSRPAGTETTAPAAPADDAAPRPESAPGPESPTRIEPSGTRP